MPTSNRIINWIRKQVKSAGAKGVVLGLSGGVDSSVVAALARKAVGRERLLCLLLPCGGSSEDRRDAELLVKTFKLKYRIFDLKPFHGYLCRILPPADKVTTGNLKARLRMLVLYYFANKMNYLVAGTGNKSELMMGYFTKYGDGGVDILPIAGLFKKDVKRLAEGLGIPKRIIAKPPSAGLWPGQTDEAEMGITYNELDGILFHLGQQKKQVAPRNLVNKVKGAIKSSQHKRSLAAVFKP